MPAVFRKALKHPHDLANASCCCLGVKYPERRDACQVRVGVYFWKGGIAGASRLSVPLAGPCSSCRSVMLLSLLFAV